MNSTIGIKELKEQASRLIRTVKEVGAAYVITHHGKPVAILRPIQEEDAIFAKSSEIQAELEEMQALASQVAAGWESEKSGVELIEEQRR